MARSQCCECGECSHDSYHYTINDDKRNIPIEYLNLSARVRNILVSEGIKKTGALMLWNRERLLDVRGISDTSLNEIERQIDWLNQAKSEFFDQVRIRGV